MTNPVEILLVEDDANDVALALRGLHRYYLDNQIHVVRDGEEALDFVFGRGTYAERSASSPPGLILLDIDLPKLSGFEVLRELKRDRQTQRIPVIILTGSNEGPDIAESHKLGANGYMVKPVNFLKLVETMRLLGFHWLALPHPPALAV